MRPKSAQLVKYKIRVLFSFSIEFLFFALQCILQLRFKLLTESFQTFLYIADLVFLFVCFLLWDAYGSWFSSFLPLSRFLHFMFQHLINTFSPGTCVHPDSMINKEIWNVLFSLIILEIKILRTVENSIKESIVGALLMNKESQAKSHDIRYLLQAFKITDLFWLTDFA